MAIDDSLTDAITHMKAVLAEAERDVTQKQTKLAQVRQQITQGEALIAAAIDRRDGLRDAVRLMELEQAQRDKGVTLVPAEWPT